MTTTRTRALGALLGLLTLVAGGCGDGSGGNVDAGGIPDGTVLCGQGQDECSGLCVTFETDNQHCGECDNACDPGEVCSAGTCAPNCATDREECGGGCFDLQTSPIHCGECGNDCATLNADAACVEGTCRFVACEPGFADCDGRAGNGCEIDLSSDRRHCGACGDACALSATCEDSLCVAGPLPTLLPPPAAGADFALTLTGQSCAVVDHDAESGDDHGGIAVSNDLLYVTGDNSTVSMSASDLSSVTALGSVLDGLVTDIASGTVYGFGTGDAIYTGGGSITQLFTIMANGAIATTIPLSAPITIEGNAGIFAGAGYMLVHNGNQTVYRANFADGAVTTLTDLTIGSYCSCETWAFWGVAEHFDGEDYLVYNDGSCGRIVRQRVSDGAIDPLLEGNFSDLCSLTYNATRGRWYFHYEGSGEFGGTEETAGYCTARHGDLACPSSELICGGVCTEALSNDANCGGCGVTCAAGSDCIQGVCDTCEVQDLIDCSGTCLDARFDPENCGGCGVTCPGAAPFCALGTCSATAPSCAAVTGASGVHSIDPDGPGGEAPFDVYCEMSDVAGEGGGWTLLGVFSNADAANRWSAESLDWVRAGAFGAHTDPTTTDDAKSPAYDRVAVSQLLIMRAPDEVSVISDAACLPYGPMLEFMRRDSESDGDCAHSCGMVVQNAPWAGQPQQSDRLLFRCMDDEGTVDVGGFDISSDDNSFVTTLDQPNHASSNFGLGAGDSSGFADWDSTDDDGADTSDSTPILLYGR